MVIVGGCGYFVKLFCVRLSLVVVALGLYGVMRITTSAEKLACQGSFGPFPSGRNAPRLCPSFYVIFRQYI